jgi:hypothetical protein
MDFFAVLNIFANAIICLGITSFFVLLFGNSNSIVHKWTVLQHWSLKTALVTIIATSAWNAMNVVYKMVIPRGVDVITHVETPIGEILMNVGLAGLFVWIVYFHYFHFMKAAPAIKTSAKKKTAKKKTRARKTN